jgi:hypothetical protein
MFYIKLSSELGEGKQHVFLISFILYVIIGIDMSVLLALMGMFGIIG